jgi:hypothetical protein
MRLSDEEALIADVVLNQDGADFSSEEIFEQIEHDFGFKFDLAMIDGVIHYLYKIDLLESTKCTKTRDLFA